MNLHAWYQVPKHLANRSTSAGFVLTVSQVTLVCWATNKTLIFQLPGRTTSSDYGKVSIFCYKKIWVFADCSFGFTLYHLDCNTLGDYSNFYRRRWQAAPLPGDVMGRWMYELWNQAKWDHVIPLALGSHTSSDKLASFLTFRVFISKMGLSMPM